MLYEQNDDNNNNNNNNYYYYYYYYYWYVCCCRMIGRSKEFGRRRCRHSVTCLADSRCRSCHV